MIDETDGRGPEGAAPEGEAVFRAGAFAGAGEVPLLVQHVGEPVGAVTVREDARGLRVAGEVAEPAASLVRSGALAGLSVGLRAFDAPPVRSAVPHAVVDEAVLADWSAATWEGREGRVAVRFVDAGERPVRLRDAIEAGEAALGAMGPALGGGWRVAARLDMALARAADEAPGDLLLCASGPGQLHLAIRTAAGIVHADAGLKRVVERPGEVPWPVLGAWRVGD